ncbi:MAG: NAD(P)/FAD-dependent oxidoreductase [Acidimicrobiia bacterium]|nr:NAD(P)/FAD-dependent oxidoreductase [Acidimicrobiia bacterium]
MNTARSLDAVVVGAGPNGLAAAITLARAGRSVVVLEANTTIGGGARTAELTEAGVRHDIASAIHPMVKASPFFATIETELRDHGLEWVNPPAAAAHPLDDARAAIAWNDVVRTAEELGSDGKAYRRYYDTWIDNVDALLDLTLNPLVRVPRRPILSARFGATAALPAATTAARVWKSAEARALFAGHAAHSILPLTRPFTSSFGVLLGTLGHTTGWGFPAGGAQSITDAMTSYLRSLGGQVETGSPVHSLADLPPAACTIFSLSPRQVDHIVGDRFPGKYRKSLQKFRYGSAAWKVDYSLDAPIPWANPNVARAGTVHLGGTLEEITEAEAVVASGHHAEKPFVLLAQHSQFDPTRAPAGVHTAWAYCHVPNGSGLDQTDAIETQIERFAPGFRDVVRKRRITSPADLEAQNMNLVGGDIGGGSYAGTQLVFRPRPQGNPFDTPDPTILIGSASTTPGAGVHGMAGHGAAERALRTVLR